MINYYKLPLDDPETYKTLCEGKTKGVFQLESNLGLHFTKQLKPTNIEHLSALGAILRPGVLECVVDCEIDGEIKQKSVTQSYCDRKNGLEPIRIDIPSCTDILEPTYGHMIYQEQLLAIASRLAGLTLEEADKFRKAVGEKKVELMNQVEDFFLTGCKKTNIVSEEEAKSVFDMMRKSQRYLFNKSHSFSYATISYWTAYAKTHYPLEFFCSYLEYAKEKMDPQREVKDLLQEMKLYNISLKIPTLIDVVEDKNHQFHIKNGIILFGIDSIKGVGQSQIINLITTLENLCNKLMKPIVEITWLDILLHGHINKTVLTNLISVGVFDHLKIQRKQMLYEYNLVTQLSPRELITIQHYPSLKIGLEALLSKAKADGGVFNDTRRVIVTSLLNSLKDPPYSLTDDIRWIFEQEKTLLGHNLTCSKLDFRDSNLGDTKCIDFINKKPGKMILCVEILTIKEYIIKKGTDENKKMAFLSVTDETGNIDCCIFAEKYETYKHLLYDNNTIIISGYRSKKDSLIIETIRDL